jgi:hypothetical protein
MKYRNKTVLGVEALEDRSMLSISIQPFGLDNLRITGNPVGNVEITGTADNQVNIQEDGVDLGTFNVAGNVKVKLGDRAAATSVTVDLAGFTMSGSWSITAGNSAGGYTVGLGDGTIEGSLSVDTGSGPDQAILSNNLLPLTVEGRVSINMNGGADSVLFLPGTDIQGSLDVMGGNFVASDIPFHVGGNLKIQSSQEALNLTVAMGVIADGNVSIHAGGGNDVVRFNEDSVIAGDLSINLDGGNDDVRLGAGIGPAGGVTITGDLTVNGGAGNDTVRFGGVDGGATVGGSLHFIGGTGDDSLIFGESSFVEGGAITMIGGSGDDSLVMADVLTAPSAHLIFQGNEGDDLVDFSAAVPVLASARIHGGSGTNNYIPNLNPLGFQIDIFNFII